MAATWSETVRIRPAIPEDVPGILGLIELLDEYERGHYKQTLTKEELLRDAFGEEKFCYILVAELKPTDDDIPSVPKGSASVPATPTTGLPSEKMEKNERLVGYALYYYAYSTWNGRALYVEDLFVKVEHRSKGLGEVMLRECAKIARSKDCVHMLGTVFDWNTRAIEFYKRIGGSIEIEWLSARMDATAIANLARSGT